MIRTALPFMQPETLPGVAREGRGRSPLLLSLKLAVTVGLCLLIFRHVEWSQLGRELRETHLWLFLLAAGLRLGGITISAFKWQQILRVHQVHFRLPQLLRWYFTGMFLSTLLPSSIGGDAYRVYKTWRNAKGRECAVLAVFFERATGMLALLLLGYAAAVITLVRSGDELSRLLVLFGMVAVGAGLVGLVVFDHWQRTSRIGHGRVAGMARRLAQFAREFRRHPRDAGLVGVLSLVFHANRLIGWWIIVLALGFAVDFPELVVASTAAAVAGLLPLSLGGLGLIDGTFVGIITWYGLELEVAVSAMLLWRALMVVDVLPGAIFYLSERRAPRTELPPVESAVLGWQAVAKQQAPPVP